MMEVEKVQRRATRFICKNNELSYKDRLISLNLLPINYWIEYLDLLFFFKCKLGSINLSLENYVSFCTGRSRRGTAGCFLNTLNAKTSLFRNSFFVRISNLWNALPFDLKSESDMNSFKKKLKSFYFSRLRTVFMPDDTRSYKLICCTCRKINSLTACCC
jgi:hypothetical protein